VRCIRPCVDEEFFFSQTPIATVTLNELINAFRFPKPKSSSESRRIGINGFGCLESILNAKLINFRSHQLFVGECRRLSSFPQAEVDKIDPFTWLHGPRVVNILDEAEALADFGAAAQLPAH